MSDWLIPTQARCPISSCPKDTALSDWLIPTQARCPISSCPQDTALSDWLIPTLPRCPRSSCPKDTAMSDWLIPTQARCPISSFRQDPAMSDWLIPTQARCPISSCCQDPAMSDWLIPTQARCPISSSCQDPAMSDWLQTQARSGLGFPHPLHQVRVKVAISAAVIVAPDALPRVVSIAARRLASGMSTICAVAINGIERQINRNKVKRRSCFFTDLSPFVVKNVCERHLCLDCRDTPPSPLSGREVENQERGREPRYGTP